MTISFASLAHFYENAISSPHSLTFVFIGYFIVLAACFYTTIKTLRKILHYRAQMKNLAKQFGLPNE